MALSPVYNYVQKLINDNLGFTIHLNGGDRLEVNPGNASFTTDGGLILKISNQVAMVEESGITHISHSGNIAT